MLKKVLFITLVLFGFTLMAEKCFADAAAQLEQARIYADSGNFNEAEATYQNIITAYAGTDYALEAQKGLTILYINWYKPAQADAAFKELVADFSGNDGAAEAVYDIAESYGLMYKYEKAEELFQYVLENWTDSEPAVWSRVDLAVLNISLGDDLGVQVHVEKLLTNFPQDGHISGALNEIADAYRRVQKYEKARELYQYALDRQPQVRDAIWSEACLVGLDVVLGDDATAQSAIEKLLTEFSEHQDTPAILNDLAFDCVVLKKCEEAQELYQYVIENWPDDNQAIWAQSGLGMASAALGNETAVQAAIYRLIADFNGDPNLPEAVSQIAEPYYDEAFRKQSEGLESQARNYFQMAITIAELVKSKVPDFVIEPDTYLWEGACYSELGEYEKSIECYQKVVDDYPGHPMAWHALFMVGRSYEDLKESGVLSKSEADARIKAAYEQLLRDYPDCKAAKYARRWLSSHNST